MKRKYRSVPSLNLMVGTEYKNGSTGLEPINHAEKSEWVSFQGVELFVVCLTSKQ